MWFCFLSPLSFFPTSPPLLLKFNMRGPSRRGGLRPPSCLEDVSRDRFSEDPSLISGVFQLFFPLKRFYFSFLLGEWRTVPYLLNSASPCEVETMASVSTRRNESGGVKPEEICSPLLRSPLPLLLRGAGRGETAWRLRGGAAFRASARSLCSLPPQN